MIRHAISDELWQRLEPLLCPTRKELRGRPAKDARLMLNGILWILHSGAAWRELPEQFGPWQTVYKRFNRWANSSLWQDILNHLARDADLEAVCLDSTCVRVHQRATGGKGGVRPRP